MLEHNQVFINEYKIDTCKIIEKLQDYLNRALKITMMMLNFG